MLLVMVLITLRGSMCNSDVDMEGHKELLGLWLSEHEDAKFWLNNVVAVDTYNFTHFATTR